MSDETIIKSTKLKKLGSGRSECEYTFTPEEVAPAEEKALKALGANIKIDGFRPGNAPAEVLREKVDPGRLFEETVRNLMPSAFEKVAKEHSLQPIIPPKVEAISREPLVVKIIFVEHPEVKLKGADKIKVEKKEIKVDEKEVERMIDYLLKQHTKATEVDREAKDGDQITMDFYGDDKDGNEIEGTRSTDHQVTIGSKVLIPGFEDELKGLKKDGKKSFTITFPDKYHAEALQGQPVTFHVTIKKIEELDKPELTDAFAKEQFQKETAADLRAEIEESMKAQEEQVEAQRRENALFDEIQKATQVDLAPELIEEEEQLVMRDFADSIAKQGLDYDQWLQQTGKKPEDLKKEFTERATSRLKLRLGIQKLVEEKGFEMTDDEMKPEVERILASIPPEEKAKVAPMYEKGNQGWEQLKWQKRVEKLVQSYLK